MGIDDNKVIMKRYFDELMNNRDYSKADEILHPDYTGSASGGINGIEGHKQYTAYVHSAFSNLHFGTVDMAAEEDKIMIINEISGLHDKEYNGVPATNKKFSYKNANVYEFKDGKVVRGTPGIVADLLGVYQQLGVLPSTPEIIKNYNDSLK